MMKRPTPFIHDFVVHVMFYYCVMHFSVVQYAASTVAVCEQEVACRGQWCSDLYPGWNT